MCSYVARSSGEDPIGNALHVTRYVFMELKKPWARVRTDSLHYPAGLRTAVERHHEVRKQVFAEGGLQALKERGLAVSLTYIAPDREYSISAYVRIIHLYRRDESSALYKRDEYVVPRDRAADLAAALLVDPQAPASFREYRQEDVDVRDLMVCTQGNVDTCCATLGYPAYRRLRRYAEALAGGLRVWEATHFQYHRFAPVVLDLPEGRCWGSLELEDLALLARRHGAVAGLRDRYLGWDGFSDKFLQAAERDAFIQEGWDWTRYPKIGRVLEVDARATRARVRIDFEHPHTGGGTYEATVEVAGKLMVPVGCLHPGDTREVNQYRVTGLARVPTAR